MGTQATFKIVGISHRSPTKGLFMTTVLNMKLLANIPSEKIKNAP